MSYLIIGKNGQAAWAMARALSDRGLSFDIVGSGDIDLSLNPKAANTIITGKSYDAVINCSAFTHVDKAETEQTAAHNLNAEAPAEMARVCAEYGIGFVHYSTDYVFDGKKRSPYTPVDAVNPVNVYGKTKALGEKGVLSAGGQSLILRTSWVYDGTGSNFLTTMLRLAQTHDTLSIVEDQIGRPTYATHLAEATLAALRHMPETSRLYHVTNSGDPITWASFARAIFDSAGLSPAINPISTAEFGAPATRPVYSVLDCTDFEADFKHALPRWQDGLTRALKERL